MELSRIDNQVRPLTKMGGKTWRQRPSWPAHRLAHLQDSAVPPGLVGEIGGGALKPRNPDLRLTLQP